MKIYLEDSPAQLMCPSSKKIDVLAKSPTGYAIPMTPKARLSSKMFSPFFEMRMKFPVPPALLGFSIP